MKSLNMLVLYGKDARYDAALTLISDGMSEVEIIEVMDAPRLRALTAAMLDTADDLDKLNDKVTLMGGVTGG